MFKHKNLIGVITAILTIIVTRIIVSSIGVENVPLEITIVIGFMSVMLAFYYSLKKVKQRTMRKKWIGLSALYSIFIIILLIIMILNEKFPYYIEKLKMPIGFLEVILLWIMVIVALLIVKSNST